MSTEEYLGYTIEFLPAQATGTLGIQTVCSAIVCDGDEEQFTVTVGITYALATREGAVPEELCVIYLQRHVHGLLHLDRFESGVRYEVERNDKWGPHSADAKTPTKAIRHEVLAASQRMARSEARSGYIPSLDVEGIADVLEVSPLRISEELVLMEIEGLVEPHAQTFGHTLKDGASRITSLGIDTLRETKASLGISDAAAEAILRSGSSSTADSEPRYDVALSFAGEQRQYVESVAEALAKDGVAVFYDHYEVVNLWGKDLYEHLDDVYRRQSRLVVIFVSSDYADKAWPTHERKSAQARALDEQGEYILPVRFDDTDLPGLRPTIGYMDARTTEPGEIAAAITTKLRSHEEVDLRRESDEPAATTAWHVDLAILWDEDGKSRYAVTWEPGRGFVQFPEGDAALDGVADTPLPGQYAIEDAIGVGHLRGKHLKFDFDSPASPVIAYLHHGDILHKPTGVGGGADEFVEFSLKRWDEIV